MKSVRLYFEKFKKQDFPLYFQLTGNEKVMQLISGTALSKEEALIRFENILQLNEQVKELGYFIVKNIQDGSFIGLAKIVLLENKEAEIGYSLLPENWGKGYGSEISQTLVKEAKRFNFIKSLIAIIDPENTASKKILEKSQFKLNQVCELEGLPAEIYTLSLVENQ